MFKAATLESSTEWITELHKHVGTSEGFLHRKTSEGIKKPWRFDNMSEY